MKLGINSNTWNPTKHSGLEFWFAKGTGITQSINKISEWTNFVNTNESFGQLTADEKPTLIADSDYAIDFDGGDHLTGQQYTFEGEFTIGIKFQVEDANAANDVIIGDNTTAANFIRLNDANTIGFKAGGTQATVDVNTSTQFNSEVETVLVVTRGSDDTIKYCIDGVVQTNTVTKSGTFLVDSLGARATDTNFFSGKIWEVVAYNGESGNVLVTLLSNHLLTI